MSGSPKFSFINLNDGQAPWIDLPSFNPNTKKIHMSPANGFTAASYFDFLHHFRDDYSITGMDCRGTWSGHKTPPGNFRMQNFADDLIQAIEIQHTSPVIAMGHSQGGFVSLLAAIKRPDLFSQLVLIEPASLPYRWLDIVYPHIPQRLLFKLMPFIKGSLNRQSIWQNKADFYARYRQHNTFKRFTEKSFNDYLEYGLTRKGKEWELLFSPQWESYIFRIVEFIWKYLPSITIPTLFIRAQHSNLYSHSVFSRQNKKLPSWIDCVEIDNTHHLLPLEAPLETSNVINNWLRINRF